MVGKLVNFGDFFSLNIYAYACCFTGEKDPWIRPLTADKIQSLYPKADRVNINAGHCPHDEAPVEVNRELRAWLNRIGHV